MKYRSLKPWKYQLTEEYVYQTDLDPGGLQPLTFLWLTTNGKLIFRKGYCWDGPSGPTIDTETFMRGSLVHDGLYQLMREGMLPQGYRRYADEVLREICLEDGMSKIRAWWVYWGVRVGAGYAAKRKDS